MKPTIIFTIGLFILLGCNQESTKENSEVKDELTTILSAILPINGLEIPVKNYSINSDQKSTIDLSSGGSINVPAGAFVDSKGKSIKGDVNIEWTEYHSLTDIMLSGIPMKYDSAGVENNFVSGGMFTINGKQNGEEIFVKPGKELMVNLVSPDDTPCYNFYSLNEETGEWKYQDTKTAEPFVSKTASKLEDETIQKKPPILIDCEVEYSQFDELKNKDIIAWKVKEELNLDQKRRVENHVSLLTLQKDDRGYFLDFKRMKLSSKIRVEPYLLEQAKAQTKISKKEIEDDYLAMRVHYQNISEGKFIRSVGVSSFGSHNWDYIFGQEDAQVLFAEFDYGKDVKHAELASLFYLCPEKNLVVKCSPENERRFFFLPKYKSGLVAVIPNKEIYALKNDGFKEIASNFGRANYTFKLNKTGKVAKDGQDVSEIIEDLFL